MSTSRVGCGFLAGFFLFAHIAWSGARAEEVRCEDWIARSDKISVGSLDFKPAVLTFSLQCKGTVCKTKATYRRTVLAKADLKYGSNYRICSGTRYEDVSYKPPSCSGRRGTFWVAVSEMHGDEARRLLGAVEFEWMDFGRLKAADCLHIMDYGANSHSGPRDLIPEQSFISEPFVITSFRHHRGSY